MSTINTIKVTSHVGRDLLASAASFKTEAAAVWEYAVNSLQYVDDAVLPNIQIIVRPREKFIEIRDNGRGMKPDGLQRFFMMHGENIDRLHGRPGRGKFGTGKSAAFGIGNVLRVDTRHKGKRNVVELCREDILDSGGKDIPVKWLVNNEATDFPNGTTVTIEQIHLPKLSTAPIIEYIERHLQSYRALKPEIAVNEHVCQYREPVIAEEFVFHPSEQQKEVLGDIELIIKVSLTPLPSSEQGIAITAGLGSLVGVEMAGIDRKEFGNYLFGEVDVLALETFQSPIEPYDSTRSLQLNPQHPVARVLLPFIGSKLEEVRRAQLVKLNQARKTEEARRLAREAQKISEILNDDFRTVMGRLQNIKSASARPGDLGSRFGQSSTSETEEGVWVEGTTVAGNVDRPDGVVNGPSQRSTRRGSPQIIRNGIPNESGNASVDPAAGQGNKAKRPRGGFAVEYRNLGEDADRSKYDPTGLTILINLDHPVAKNALRSGGVDDINFRRLSYEIAFTEYAIALGYELAEQDPDIPADDLLYEVRTTLNRVSASAALLYA